MKNKILGLSIGIIILICISIVVGLSCLNTQKGAQKEEICNESIEQEAKESTKEVVQSGKTDGTDKKEIGGEKKISEEKIPKKVNELLNKGVLNTTFSTKNNSIQRLDFGEVEQGVFFEQVVITINDYNVNFTTGLVTIPDTIQYTSFNEPILPELFVKKTLPFGSNMSNIAWNETASQYAIVENDVPIAGIASSEAAFEGSFSYNEFYPIKPYTTSSLLTLGGGGTEVNTVIFPVQYNSQTGKTKIWTKRVYNLQYNVPDTGISVIDFSTDKQLYSQKDNVILNVTLSNVGGEAKTVNLNIVLREFNRNEYLAEIGSMHLPARDNVSRIYTKNLQNVIPTQAKEGILEIELIVIDARNDEVLASRILNFQLEEVNPQGDRE
jgi:hypothetical protein